MNVFQILKKDIHVDYLWGKEKISNQDAMEESYIASKIWVVGSSFAKSLIKTYMYVTNMVWYAIVEAIVRRKTNFN